MTFSKQTLFALTIAALWFSACNSPVKKHESEPEIQTAKIDSMPVKSKILDIVYPKITDSTSYPDDSLFTIQVLTAGEFHGDEVWENADKENWFGLFQNKSGFYLEETLLKTKKVYDPIMDDEESDKTGWGVETVNKDNSIILIEDLEYLSSHKIKQAILTKEEILPGDTLSIKYMGINYQLFATGDKLKIHENPDYDGIWNYKLYLTATINGVKRKSMLVAQPDFDDQMINLIFAGDIDGDKILDLIIDTSGHYNMNRPTVYLSKPAENGEVVKPVGAHTHVGC